MGKYDVLDILKIVVLFLFFLIGVILILKLIIRYKNLNIFKYFCMYLFFLVFECDMMYILECMDVWRFVFWLWKDNFNCKIYLFIYI